MNRNAIHSVLLASSAALSLFAAACADHKPQPWAMRPITRDYTFPARDDEGKEVEGGLTVTAADLETGRQMYIHYCYACHGMNGDGKGPASVGLRPPPRDLRMGKYKFDTVAAGLPNDIDFQRILRGGLHGTAMLPWDITKEQADYLIQFIKTFPKPPCAPYGEVSDECATKLAAYPDSSLEADLGTVWEEVFAAGKNKGKLKPTGEPVVPQHYDETGKVVADPPADPWAGKEAEAIAKGEELYHFKLQCTTCHAHYLPRKAIYDYLVRQDPYAKVSFRGDPDRQAVYYSIPQPNAVPDFGIATMPPDFTMNPLRSIRPGSEMADLYRLIASGVGVMPSWAQSAKPDELWALAHYVKSLRDLALPANAAKRDALKAKLLGDTFDPPPPKPRPEAAPAAEEGAGGGDAADKKDGATGDAKTGDNKPADAKK